MSKQVPYDPQVLNTFAAELYAKARSIIVLSSLSGLIAGAAAGFVGSIFTKELYGLDATVVVAAGAGLGALLGFSSAQAKAFALRFQAQTLLVQKQIEQNTRRAAEAAERSAGSIAA